MNTVGIKWRFNIEGGCYAKAIHLSKQKEPQIYNAIKYGTILENTVTNDDGTVDFDDNTYTENTRAAYPIDYREYCYTFKGSTSEYDYILNR